MPSYRVFATCNIGDQALQKLRDQGYEVEVFGEVEAPPKALILEKVRSGIDALITTLRDPIDADVLEAGEGTLKVVAQDAVGVDNIDQEVAGRLGIPVTNTADVLTEATAEFAFFMMGSVARKLWPSERLVRENQWTGWHPSHPFLGDELAGKTVAVIGTGRIGKAFARRCLGAGVDILLHNRTPDEAFADALQAALDVQHEHGLTSRRHTARYVSLEDALREADFVSLHVPLTDQTQGLIDAAALEQMKETAYLINTARGPVVDETALVQALKEKKIAGAALDVFLAEPLPADSPLRDDALADRVRLFHHFGSGTKETRLAPDPDVGMAGRCVQGVLDVLEDRYGGDPSQMPFVVNKEAFAETAS
ncbi:MAG: 2-hydroxyacid dehydrogenase [Rhodothermales bacterium]